MVSPMKHHSLVTADKVGSSATYAAATVPTIKITITNRVVTNDNWIHCWSAMKLYASVYYNSHKHGNVKL
jgi:hypothetical protein